MTSIKLYYFDSTYGRAQAMKLAFAIAGIEFEDVKFTFESWPKYKTMSPTGYAPFMEIDGQMFVESVPLMMYAGRLAKLVPGNLSPIDVLKIEQALAYTDSMRQEVYRVMFGFTGEAKTDAIKKLHEQTMPNMLKNLDKLLETKIKSIPKEQVDICDVAVFCWMEDLIHGAFDYPPSPKEHLQQYHHIKQCYDKVAKIDKIKPYLAQH